MLRVITSPLLFCYHACPSFKGCRLEKPVDAKTNTVARQLITLATDLDSVQISQISPLRLECVSFRSLETRRKQLSRGNFVKQTSKSVRQPVITHLRFTFLLVFSSQIQPKLLKAESSRLRELGGATERLEKIHVSKVSGLVAMSTERWQVLEYLRGRKLWISHTSFLQVKACLKSEFSTGTLKDSDHLWLFSRLKSKLKRISDDLHLCITADQQVTSDTDIHFFFCRM